ncbi:HAD-IIIC family phosphatase [Kitasatospora sp. NPDC101176]|uniref:HAD-IIIC family phosphatase n=1 Tax=Kitasatospora sp. NPDC101176 TaxID=3364099 RepID=UPI0038278E63
MGTTTDGLRTLHRAGRLAAEYPAVPRLLDGAGDDELALAGNLLARLDPDEVLRLHPGTTAVTIAVTGHGTLASLRPALTAELARHGLLLRPHFTDFDSYVFELSDPGSGLYAAAPQLVLCVLDPAVVLDELPLPWGPDDVEAVLAAKTALLGRLAARFAATAPGATLVLNTLPLLHRHTAQLVDLRARARLGAVWREANARLLRIGEEHPATVVLDLEPLANEGVPVQDPRLDAYAKAHLSPALLTAYARQAGHLARALTGRTRKVLAVDLDNTLWGGILGDDGPEGIELAGTHTGEAFRTFQRAIRQLTSQGVLLAAVSKNDPEPVAQVLAEHPDSVLRTEDFVRVIANWRPKDENLTSLADSLNLGIDSVVFADDSPFERGAVRAALPAVAVVDLDGEPALHLPRLLRDGWFDVREATAEDRARPARYREELARGDFLQSFSSLDDYLAELDVRVSLTRARPQDVPRISQLTLRTNQFNLTTERLQPAEVAARAEHPDHLVLAVRSADRFGENGLVGAVLLRREEDGARLDVENFLLSCRVFSRGVEHAALAEILRHAAATGVREVRGRYRPSARNGTVRDLFPRYGFTAVAEQADGASAEFRHDLAEPLAPPAWVTLDSELAVPATETGAGTGPVSVAAPGSGTEPRGDRA